MGKTTRVLIPNAITLANCFCGFFALISLYEGQVERAAWSILLAGLFDLLDGRVARLIRGTSEFGEQFDTLSDLLSFGVAPGLLAYVASLKGLGSIGWLPGFLFTTAVAVRLARFSLDRRLRPGFFEGLSSPVGAVTFAAYILFVSRENVVSEAGHAWLLPLVVLLSILMVSTLKYPSFKNVRWKSGAGQTLLALGLLALVLIALNPRTYLFIFGALFIGSALGFNLICLVRGKSLEAPPLGESEFNS